MKKVIYLFYLTSLIFVLCSNYALSQGDENKEVLKLSLNKGDKNSEGSYMPTYKNPAFVSCANKGKKNMLLTVENTGDATLYFEIYRKDLVGGIDEIRGYGYVEPSCDLISKGKVTPGKTKGLHFFSREDDHKFSVLAKLISSENGQGILSLYRIKSIDNKDDKMEIERLRKGISQCNITLAKTNYVLDKINDNLKINAICRKKHRDTKLDRVNCIVCNRESFIQSLINQPCQDSIIKAHQYNSGDEE